MGARPVVVRVNLPAYDSGDRTRRAHRRYLARVCRTGDSALPGPPPTAAGLERHASRFGPELVAETAAEYGLSVTVERPARRRVGGGPTLRQRVAALVAAGHGVEVVAEVEDLSPARARRLVGEVTT